MGLVHSITTKNAMEVSVSITNDIIDLHIERMQLIINPQDKMIIANLISSKGSIMLWRMDE